MNRGSGWVSATECSLFEDATIEEKSGFLEPIDALEGVEHIGWKGYDPVFVVTTTVTRVRSNLQSVLDAGKFSSSGHIAYILSEQSSDVLSDLVLLLKVEDWMIGCIPNTLHENTEERMSYISGREEKMSENLESKLGDGTVIYDRHIDIVGEYGQYQFLGVK
jgi:hypothetical protein